MKFRRTQPPRIFPPPNPDFSTSGLAVRGSDQVRSQVSQLSKSHSLKRFTQGTEICRRSCFQLERFRGLQGGGLVDAGFTLIPALSRNLVIMTFLPCGRTFLPRQDAARNAINDPIPMCTVSTKLATTDLLLTSLFCFTFAMPRRFSLKQFILPFFSLINISHETLSPRLDNGLAITPPMG
jgi:hypothetical protein